MNLQNSLSILNIGLSLVIAWFALRKFRLTSAIHLAVLSFIVAFWSIAYLFYDAQIFRFPIVLFVGLNYLFSAFAATFLLTFSLTYSNRYTSINRLTLLLFAIEPLITQVLFWVKPWRDVFFQEQFSSLSDVLPGTGVWSVVSTAYLYNLEIASVVLITGVFIKKPRDLLFQAGALLAGAFIPFLFRLIDMVGPNSFALFNHAVIGYSFSILGLAYGLFRQVSDEAPRITHEAVVTGMADGWMVLDLNGNIVDVNPAAEKVVGYSRENLLSKPIRDILQDWPDISNATDGGKELEMRRSIKAQDTWRYLNVRLSILRDKDGEAFGQLIVWRDITERKLAEEARQRARDEMFVLLNAISNAASHSINLDDFLSESVYQIIYPFQSQLVSIFLVDEKSKGNPSENLYLASYFGLSSPGAMAMSNIVLPKSIFEDVIVKKQIMAIDDVQNESRVPDAIKEIEISNLVILPLLTQAGEDSRVLGAICLGRKDPNPYTQDELIRLTAIAEQIANLVDSDRRRQLAIALSEREKLMRDLHDSVSQKLYGLVAITEAAQAAIEAGTKVIPSEVLGRIGDNARQAVKEMRLFLYQMQPVDLEKGDLVFALHQRLGAVEGRASIQVRFLADEGIALSKDKEVALYYIAQEALNNTLKHARANSVTIRLRQTQKSVILEIVDNGEGFDMKNVKQGGMGLQNMKARVSQIDGRLTITSKPGSGTTVKVTVSRERRPKQIRKR